MTTKLPATFLLASSAALAGLTGCSSPPATRATSALAPAPTTVVATDTTWTMSVASVTVAATTSTSRPVTTTVAPTTVATTTVSTTAATVPPTTARARTTSDETPTTSAAPPACPDNLANSLTTTGGARQLITAVGSGYSSTYATVEIWQRQGGCWVPAGGPWTGRAGANGYSDHHREGDETTPTGLFPIGSTVYGNAPNPGYRGPYHALQCGDWWDEDPTSEQYNEFVAVGCAPDGTSQPGFGGGSEALWTETVPYPSFAVIGYNPARLRVPPLGSGVFLHADTGGPTAGCISIPLPDLDLLLRWLDPSAGPQIAMGPASEIGRF